MTFKELFPLFIAGTPIKRKGWGGFWRWGNMTGIYIFLSDGRWLNLKDSDNMLSTIAHTLVDDWEIATKENVSVEAGKCIL